MQLTQDVSFHSQRVQKYWQKGCFFTHFATYSIFILARGLQEVQRCWLSMSQSYITYVIHSFMWSPLIIYSTSYDNNSFIHSFIQLWLWSLNGFFLAGWLWNLWWGPIAPTHTDMLCTGHKDAYLSYVSWIVKSCLPSLILRVSWSPSQPSTGIVSYASSSGIGTMNINENIKSHL